jgi:hypothetical protein
MQESKNTVYKIGDKVSKKSGKPFKSQNKVNTIKGFIVNPNTNLEALTFEEDDSVVDIKTVQKQD